MPRDKRGKNWHLPGEYRQRKETDSAFSFIYHSDLVKFHLPYKRVRKRLYMRTVKTHSFSSLSDLAPGGCGTTNLSGVFQVPGRRMDGLQPGRTSYLWRRLSQVLRQPRPRPGGTAPHRSGHRGVQGRDPGAPPPDQAITAVPAGRPRAAGNARLDPGETLSVWGWAVAVEVREGGKEVKAICGFRPVPGHSASSSAGRQL